MKKIVVASRNPVKIKAAAIGFKKVFPQEKIIIQGISVSSGVSDQPKTEAETLRGALNRAKNLSQEFPGADFYVGIEGGVKKEHPGTAAFAWIVIRSKSGKIGKGRTGSFFLPEKVVKLIRQGKELGEADDIVLGGKNSKHKGGTIGNLTKNIITRTKLYFPAVIYALIPFINEDLYQD
jgi:inosine/xanthosine triphosphatase